MRLELREVEVGPPRSAARALWTARPKSKSDAETGSPSTSWCRSTRCQPRGRISSVAISSFSRYVLSGVSSEISRADASLTFRWPSTTFSHVGELASSKSAMKTRAPELSALIIILRSTGPVISQRRSRRSAGAGATRQSPSRIVLRLGEEAGGSRRRRGCAAARAAPRAARAAADSARGGGARRGERLAGLPRRPSSDLPSASDAHASSFVNCASSVEPLSASVSLSGETACVTRSK